ncbi:uncharacterized protein EV422DRAFT_532857 [Fimicolochytrium jonesii]|uniref:uncharacterized protein n=1 Tax=Fimicolochytrium jonesii TaxID=1396493 RepID=UPI0022FDF773|nr:uncharacterized protein EV422DRAFT_532857 [Fimicolochytrium jonesii]KAI8819934.1 hypothetical protein EV422DRAFT_532857 [Fimicolochytrium jonesii]
MLLGVLLRWRRGGMSDRCAGFYALFGEVACYLTGRGAFHASGKKGKVCSCVAGQSASCRIPNQGCRQGLRSRNRSNTTSTAT